MSAVRAAFIFSESICSVLRTPPAIRRQCETVLTQSRRGSTDSWMSLLYAVGRLLRVERKPDAYRQLVSSGKGPFMSLTGG
jgi:hypothetical protein